MKYIPHPSPPSDDFDVDEFIGAYKRYYDYLESIKDKLSTSAYEFAKADWHYNFHDPRCPHDAWLEVMDIREPGFADVSEREIEITIRLLDAYHSGHITLLYERVRSYSFQKNFHHPSSPGRARSHGDWMIDEISLSEHELVLHEIQFELGLWIIECENLSYQWEPLAP